MLRGFKTRNIAGMLDWFKNGIPPRGPAPGKQNHARAPDPDLLAASRVTEARWAAREAALESHAP
jgi:hypothetical protein